MLNTCDVNLNGVKESWVRLVVTEDSVTEAGMVVEGVEMVVWLKEDSDLCTDSELRGKPTEEVLVPCVS